MGAHHHDWSGEFAYRAGDRHGRGSLVNRYGQTWLSRQFATRHSDVTAALIGIAGAFIGFHLAVILGLLPSPLMLFIAAAIGALVVLWVWRVR